MKIVAISDLHGFLPEIPECELLLICGDICPVSNHSIDFQAHWLDTEFRWWLKKVPAKKIVSCFGNHDFIGQEAPHKVPSLPWIYLQDSRTEYEGLKIWASPHQPIFFDWAFNLSEKDLAEKWKLIPDDIDILVLHGPPYGYGDQVRNAKGFENAGSPSLLARIKEIKPKLVVFGHIHSGRGIWQLDGTTLANVTIVNEQYQNVHEPMIFEI